MERETEREIVLLLWYCVGEIKAKTDRETETGVI